MVVSTDLSPKMQKRWDCLKPLLLKGEDINTNIVARVFGCDRTSVMRIVRQMRKRGLPIPQVSLRETVDDYGYCPDCGELLSVALVGNRDATRYCPECAWDEDLDRGKPVYTRFVSTTEAAEMLGVGTSTIVRRIKSGTLPATKSNHTTRSAWRIPMYAIEARLDERHS